MQTLISIPEVREPYADADSIFKSAPDVPHSDLATQLAKLIRGSYSDSRKPYEEGMDVKCATIRPTAFKSFIGKGQNHQAFSGGQQQDAMEFWDHVMVRWHDCLYVLSEPKHCDAVFRLPNV